MQPHPGAKAVNAIRESMPALTSRVDESGALFISNSD